MIGLDTNVLVRYIAQDDPAQSAKATKLVEGLSVTKQGFVTLVSVVELVWVLQGCYSADKAQTIQVLSELLNVDTLVIQHGDTVRKALKAYDIGNADFPDCLITCAAVEAGCSGVMTFDKKAASSAAMTLIK